MADFKIDSPSPTTALSSAGGSGVKTTASPLGPSFAEHVKEGGSIEKTLGNLLQEASQAGKIAEMQAIASSQPDNGTDDLETVNKINQLEITTTKVKLVLEKLVKSAQEVLGMQI